MTFCGHVFVPSAQAGRLLRAGRAFVALKMLNVTETMDRTMRLQLKFTPLRMNFAIRTRVLTFCELLVAASGIRC